MEIVTECVKKYVMKFQTQGGEEEDGERVSVTFCEHGTKRTGSVSSESDIDILEVRDSLSHASDSSNDVAMGDHDTLGDACGAAGVHDDGDVRGLWLSAVYCYCGDRRAERATVRGEMDRTHKCKYYWLW